MKEFSKNSKVKVKILDSKLCFINNEVRERSIKKCEIILNHLKSGNPLPFNVNLEFDLLTLKTGIEEYIKKNYSKNKKKIASNPSHIRNLLHKQTACPKAYREALSSMSLNILDHDDFIYDKEREEIEGR